NDGYGWRKCALALSLPRPFAHEVKVVARTSTFLNLLPGLRADRHHRNPGRNHERFLRSDNDDVEPPLVGVQGRRSQTRYGVDHEEGVFLAFDQGSDSFNIHSGARGCFFGLDKK